VLRHQLTVLRRQGPAPVGSHGWRRGRLSQR
jgi:hypothetical protein